ncbi:MAG: MaoC family dehydratase [Henriciella sp.]|jgi:3-hydroxybutyryl-CoA dehydratase|nr:MaoC family dehydratase [Henriciella sp.]
MTFKDGYKFEDLSLGMSHETHHKITENDIQLFAEVSGDHNPLHMNEEYASKTSFGQRIAHGALTASYISGILGNNLPGPGSIFTGLSMRFRRPVYIGSDVTVRAEVTELLERGNRVTLKVTCIVDGKAAISGEAKVMVPSREA